MIKPLQIYMRRFPNISDMAQKKNWILEYLNFYNY